MISRSAGETKPGLRDYWQILLRRKWLISLPIIVMISIALPGSFLLTPLYRASTVLITDELQRASVLQGVAHIPVPAAERMGTIRQKIESRAFLMDIADRIGIADYLASVGRPTGNNDVVKYLRRIIGFRSRGGRIFEITTIHEDPHIAKDLSDIIAKVYVDRTLTWRQSTVTDTLGFIKKELEVYRQKLQNAEEALLEAQESGAIDSLEGEDRAVLNRLGKLRASLAETEFELKEAKSMMRSANKRMIGGVAGGHSAAYYMDPEIGRLQAKLASLQTQYSQLSMNYTDQYPQVRTLKVEIVRTEAAIARAKAKYSGRTEDIAVLVEYWRDQIDILEVRKLALAEEMRSYDKKLAHIPKRQLELSRLRREKSTVESVYSMLLSRINSAELLQASELANMGRVAEVLDPAMLPDIPVSPNRKKILILALAMGLFIGCGSAFLLEYFDRSFHAVDEVSEYLGVPVLATIPELNTFESELREKRRRRVMVTCIVSVSLLMAILTIDLVSAGFSSRDSFFLNVTRGSLHIARSRLDFLRSVVRNLRESLPLI